jgi:hypothetical protein
VSVSLVLTGTLNDPNYNDANCYQDTTGVTLSPITIPPSSIGMVVNQLAFALNTAPVGAPPPTDTDLRMGLYVADSANPGNFLLLASTNNLHLTATQANTSQTVLLPVQVPYTITAAGVYYFALTTSQQWVWILCDQQLFEPQDLAFNYTASSPLPNPLTPDSFLSFPQQSEVVLCSAASSVGDPLLTGFDGRSFQVHGVERAYYNLISTPLYQLNSQWIFLGEGVCTEEVKSRTTCWSHPGTYQGQMGLRVTASEGGEETRVLVASGPHDVGLAVVVNSQPISISPFPISLPGINITYSTPFTIELATAEYTLRLDNSDLFLNSMLSQSKALLSTLRLHTHRHAISTGRLTLPHGLIGQSWTNEGRLDKGKGALPIQGEIDDYVVEDGMWGVGFVYNRYTGGQYRRRRL